MHKFSNEEIVSKINSFDHWIDQFDINGNLTPVPDPTSPSRTMERKSYILDSLINSLGGSLKGKRILDIGCNAGYWSLSAIEAGAEFVLGVDARKTHIDQANFVFSAKQIPDSRYKFIESNVFDINLDDYKKFDIVFCLGFFHHVSKHMLLLELISKYNLDILVLETRISRLPGNLLQFMYSNKDHYANSYEYTLSMLPTKSAVFAMVDQFGYKGFCLKPNSRQKRALVNYAANRRRAFIFSKTAKLNANDFSIEQITPLSVFRDCLNLCSSYLLGRVKRFFL